MTVHIALLRGVNVGGNNLIAMSALRSLFAALGFPDARSLLQSGNVAFTSAGRAGAELERLLETETERRLGVRTDYLVRTSAEWRAVVAGNPFRAEAKKDPGRLLVHFLKKAPRAEDVEALQDALRGPEIVRVKGRHAYIVYPEGVGRSKLTPSLLESKLGARGTGRNWNTVLKLAALCGGAP